MLAEVLTSAGRWNSEQPLLTYSVPAEMETALQAGQLVVVPYGERLVEGIVWRLRASDDNSSSELEDGVALRPVREILDPEPALLPYQRELAEWISYYYATPLSQVVLMMLTRGLMQRSQFVLRVVENELLVQSEALQEVSPEIRALVGLLLSEGELDMERFKKMLGPKKARQYLKEALATGLITREARLKAAQAKVRKKRIVRLCIQGEELEEWRRSRETAIERSLAQTGTSHNRSVTTANEPQGSLRRRRGGVFRSLADTGTTATLTREPQDKAGITAQRQLAAVNLLLQSPQGEETTWTPHKLCEASKLTEAQLRHLLEEHIVTIEETEVRRDPLLGRNIPATTAPSLTPAQRRALKQILEGLNPPPGNIPTPVLLHGVTGSGKTEVYLQALAAVIEQGQRGIVLVPEIALTTQAVQRIAGRFPGRVAIIHSALGLGERYDEWRRIRAGEVDIVIGPRAALFAPVPDLGIIIIDEEHEPAYKQNDLKPTYHARETALVLGQILRIPVVLGSATPSVESFYRSQQGHYRLVVMEERIGMALPAVEIVDLRRELHEGNTSIISRRLHSELERVLSHRQQAILFLNRRGAASCILCRECGYVAICDRCDIPFTYHSTEYILLCHYCGRKHEVIQFCPACHSSGIRYFGLGTEKVQETIQRAFPAARLLRWDRDSTKTRRAHEKLLDSFANREADILIGTQMIAKGLDLPEVTLVGVVSADIALNIPDYAASERAFSLLTQVAGRAGRGMVAGNVIIQTFNPQHFCIDAASRHDYHEFYSLEIEARRQYNYPPFRQFVKFTYSHENRHRCQNEALLLGERLSAWIERLGMPHTDLIGPAPATLERLRGKYRWQIMVRGLNLHRLLRVIEAPGWDIDIDPTSSM